MVKLNFKVYLVKDTVDWEIAETRRFIIDSDVATNFVYLQEKLLSLFPNIRGKKFTVNWKDDENETITVSTNEELEIALNEMAMKNVNENDIYRLYIIQECERESVDMSKIGKILHPGVICDICDNAIYGFRFKCMQCADYDLCTECMSQGNHPEHYMVRMTEPVEWSGHHGRRLAHHVRRFLKRTTQHNKDEEQKCSYKSNKQYACPMSHKSSDESHKQKRTKDQHREPSAEAATEATEDTQQETRQPSFLQLLKIVEDNISNISQFLDPLGINLPIVTPLLNDVDPKRNKPNNDTQAKASEQKPEDNASAPSEESAKKFPGEGKKLRDDVVGTTDDKPSVSKPATSPTQKEATAPVSTSAEQASEAEEWTLVQRESCDSRASPTSSLNGTAMKQNPTPSAPIQTSAEPQTELPKQNIYPSLPAGAKEYFHPNPKIQRAVEAMMAMGFSNESGWLTHLLVSKDGDIDKALDVLQPVSRHH